MGLGASLDTDTGKVFSDDILKITIQGPEEEHLTIIDVPGIFRTRTKGVSKKDISMVRDLVINYISNERTVILAVIPCNVQFATSEILELAEEFDPEGERTLAVLTKPDKVREAAEQKQICDLVQTGKGRPLRLGYRLVRNHGEDCGSMTLDELDESLLTTPPWSTLPRDRVGVASLKKELGEVLLSLAAREFPAVIHEINAQVADCESRLNSLGESRSKERDQRKYLGSVVESFQRLVRAGLDASYHADESFFKPENRLITQITNLTKLFRQACAETGHTWSFEGSQASQTHEQHDKTSTDDKPHEAARRLLRLDGISSLGWMQAQLPALFEAQQIDAPLDHIKDWIGEVYQQSRAPHLASFDPKLISLYFAAQSRKWEHLTNGYIRRVMLVIHGFMDSALSVACSDMQVNSEIWSSMMARLIDRYKCAVKAAELLVFIERQNTPYTTNKSFYQSLTKLDQIRYIKDMRSHARLDSKTYEEPQYIISLKAAAELGNSTPSPRKIPDRIHDILQAYYNIALDRFVDNIFKQVIDYSLLHGPKSPLSVFCNDWVYELGQSELAQIAGESSMTKRSRASIKKELANLCGALEDIKRE